MSVTDVAKKGLWCSLPMGDAGDGIESGARQTKNLGARFCVGEWEWVLSESRARCALCTLHSPVSAVLQFAACHSKVGQRTECFSELEDGESRCLGQGRRGPGSQIGPSSSIQPRTKHVPPLEKIARLSLSFSLSIGHLS